jgi:hypothetical protein
MTEIYSHLSPEMGHDAVNSLMNGIDKNEEKQEEEKTN